MIKKLDYIIKNLDFKKKIFFSILIVLSFMIMGYATYSTSLFATGGTEITQDYENFKVIIDKVIYDGYINEINNDNVSFSFTTNLSDDLTESDLYVELFNDSEQYDVNATLLCDAVSDSTYSITLDKSQFRLNAKTKDVVNIKLNKLGEFINKTINCQFTIEGLEKNELANDYTEDAPSSNEILVERSSDSDNKTLKEELDELRRMAKDRGIDHTGEEFTFDYTGSSQTFTVPYNGSYKIELWGAQGGTVDSYAGGLGAYTSGEISLNKNQTLYLYVGGAGSYTKTGNTFVAGGYNGGGDAQTEGGSPNYATSGGGATDIRIINGNWDSFNSLKSRIMVAAGGGGSDYGSGSYTGIGGAGGGLNGYDGTSNQGSYYGTGATQISGGISVLTNVVSGSFGKGGSDPLNNGNGGSGYYGGGAGTGYRGGGGSGSSYISGYSGCNAIAETSTSSSITHTGQPNHYSGKVFTNAVMIDGKGCDWSTGSATNCGTNQPQPTGSNLTGHSGNGYAKITYLGNN